MVDSAKQIKLAGATEDLVAASIAGWLKVHESKRRMMRNMTRTKDEDEGRQ